MLKCGLTTCDYNRFNLTVFYLRAHPNLNPEHEFHEIHAATLASRIVTC